MESMHVFLIILATVFIGIPLVAIMVIASAVKYEREKNEEVTLEKERLRKEAMSDTRPIYCRNCGARPGAPSKCHHRDGHDWVRGT